MFCFHSTSTTGRSVSAFRLTVNMPNGLIYVARRSRPRSKRRRGDASPAPFCCPSLKVMDVDFDLCGGIYPKGARHNGLLCGRKPDNSAFPLRIRRCYVECCHTQQPAQPTTPCQNGVMARHVQTTTARAACERRALDGVAVSCEAMKRDGVKRRRERSGHTWNGAISRGQVHRLLRSVRCHCDSEGAGLAVLLQAP